MNSKGLPRRRRFGYIEFSIASVLLAIAAVAAIVIIDAHFFPANGLDQSRNIITIAGFVGLSFAAVQLYFNYLTKKAEFLASYVSKLHTDRLLSDTFTYLVADYRDEIFDEVQQIFYAALPKLPIALTEQEISDVRKTGESERFRGYLRELGPIIFQSRDRPREPGFRPYHPDCFQGSEEERRLDSLLGYLDVVGYYYSVGLVSVQELRATMGYQLGVLKSRRVIRRYLGNSDENWWKSQKEYTFAGAPLPFLYTRLLLKDFITNGDTPEDEDAPDSRVLKI